MGYKEQLASTKALTRELSSGKQNFVTTALDLATKEFNPKDPSDLAKPMPNDLAIIDDTFFGGRFQKAKREMYLNKIKPQLELQAEKEAFLAQKRLPSELAIQKAKTLAAQELRETFEQKQADKRREEQKKAKKEDYFTKLEREHQTFIEQKLPIITNLLPSRTYGSDTYTPDLLKHLRTPRGKNSLANSETLFNTLDDKREDGIRFYDSNTQEPERAGQQIFTFENEQGNIVSVYRDSNKKSRSLNLKSRKLRESIVQDINNLDDPSINNLKDKFMNGTLTSEERSNFLNNENVKGIITTNAEKFKVDNLIQSNELLSAGLDNEYTGINNRILLKQGISTQAQAKVQKELLDAREAYNKAVAGLDIGDPAKFGTDSERLKNIARTRAAVEAAKQNVKARLTAFNDYGDKRAGALLEVAWKQKVQQRVHQVAFNLALADKVLLTTDNAQRYIQQAITRLKNTDDPILESSREKIIKANEANVFVPTTLDQVIGQSTNQLSNTKSVIPAKKLNPKN